MLLASGRSLIAADVTGIRAAASALLEHLGHLSAGEPTGADLDRKDLDRKDYR
ncbi:MAG: hypothetical protein M3083_01885 [Actinomycetota bacterium]|nr:hypothetical protein [Actinomycetota bacterium]